MYLYNYVYISTNKLNGKQYIGSHFGEENDSYFGSGKVLLKALKKYGKSNFKKEILEVCDTSMNLLLETKYIEEYDTLQPKGYNVSPTGGHQKNGKLSEKTKQKLRKPKTDEAKKNMSESRKGMTFSDKHKENIRKSKLGNKHPNFGKKRDRRIVEKIAQSNRNRKIKRGNEIKSNSR